MRTVYTLAGLALAVGLVMFFGKQLSRADDGGKTAQAGTWEFPQDWFWHDSDDQRAKHTPLLGQPAPKLELKDWKNSDALNLPDLKGKVVVVDFFATWCGPCMASIPHNNELYAKYKEQGVVFIGVCTSSNGQETFADVVTGKGIKYPAAADPTLASEKAWNVMWYPTYAVVDRAGKLRAIGLRTDFVEKVIQKLAAEPAPAK